MVEATSTPLVDAINLSDFLFWGNLKDQQSSMSRMDGENVSRLIAAATAGFVSFETQADRDLETSLEVGRMSYVWGEVLDDDNGFYIWDGTTWLETDIISAAVKSEIQTLANQAEEAKAAAAISAQELEETDLAWSVFSAFKAADSSPKITDVKEEGWKALVPQVTPNPSLDKVKLYRLGYSDKGWVTGHWDYLYATTAVREPYPNQLSVEDSTVALSDYSYVSDVAMNVENLSTQVSPKPIAAWVMPSKSVVGDSLHWEMVAFHKDGRPNPETLIGSQVACVRVRATDGTNYTSWQVISETQISTLVSDGNPVEVYQGDLDISQLADSSEVWLEGEVFPWFGRASSVLKSEESPSGCYMFDRRYFLRDTTLFSSPNIVFVKSTGNDGSGVCSTDETTAKNSPFLTLTGAIAGANSQLGNTTGVLDGLIVYIEDSINTGSFTYNIYKQNLGCITVKNAPGVSTATAVVNHSARFTGNFNSKTGNNTESCLRFEGITYKPTANWQFDGSANHELVLQFVDCVGDFTSGSLVRSYSSVEVYGLDLTAYTTGSSQPFNYTSAGEVRILRSLKGDLLDSSLEGRLTVGCDLSRCGGFSRQDPTKDTVFFDNSFTDTKDNTVTIFIRGNAPNQVLGGIVVAQNLIETTGVTQVASIRISGDSDYGDITHAVVIHNTCTGAKNSGRLNVFYNDHSSILREHFGICFKANLTPSNNMKGDIFTSDGLRVGNFAIHHGVGMSGNFTIDENADGGSLSFGWFYEGIGSVFVGGSPMFVDDQSVTYSGSSPVAGSGGGNYRLQSGSPAMLIQEKPLLGFDLDGASRGTGPQDSGCYQSSS